MKKKFPFNKVLIIPAFAALVFVLSFAMQDAHATTSTLDSVSCPAIGGVWVPNTCTVSSSGNIIAVGDELVIPAGAILVIENSGGTGIDNAGTLNNNSGGTINVQNSGSSSIGINNQGTLTNSGTITIANSGISVGINNSFVITPFTINLGTITNNSGGTINVQTSDGRGIDNAGTLNNNSGGIINVQTSDAIGIINNVIIINGSIVPNSGTLTNSGTITIANSGGFGLSNFEGTLNNNSGGIINVQNSGRDGIDNFGTLTNSGTITIANSGSSDGINNYSDGTITNSGTIDAQNSGNSIGINNNSGTITNNSGGTIDAQNSGGIGINNNSGGTINSVGKLTNLLGGSIINSGYITCTGNCGNSGSIINSGDITCTGKCGNFGLIIINSGGTITINSGGILTNRIGASITTNLGGTINNSGTANNCGTISGSISGNQPVDCTRTGVLPNPSTVAIGKTVTFTGKVTDTASPESTPSGTVSWDDGGKGGTFTISGVPTSTCPLSSVSFSEGTCKITYAPPPTATEGTVITIKATYSGDSTHQTSSDTSTLTVLRATSTSISPSSASVVHGGSILYTVTVTDTTGSGTKSAPTGTVSWAASVAGGSFSSNTCTLAPISSSQSQCTVTYTAPLIAGTDTITASYGGDSLHAKSFAKSTLTVT